MKKTIRLIWQLYPTYLFITLIALGAVSWYASHFLQDYFYQRTFSDLKNQGRLAQVMMLDYLEPVQPASVDRACKEIGRFAPTRVTVILPDGKVIGDSEESPASMDNHLDRPEMADAVAGRIGQSQRYSRTLDMRMMYVATPVVVDGSMRAIVRTSLPLTGVDAELADIQKNIVWGGLLIAVLASVVSYLVSRKISRPIEEMRIGAENFAKGELSHRLPFPSTRETAALAMAMNHMAERLENRIEAETGQRIEMEAILSSMTEGVVALDREERIVSFNRAASQIVRGLKDRAKGQGIQELVRNLPFQKFMERIADGQTCASEDIVLHQEDSRMVNVHATPLRDARNQRIGTLLVLNDVTQLRHLEKMRQDFVANVSHEIKTPLTAIKGFVETLQNGAKDRPEEAGRFISIIEKHANRLEAIVEDLLQLSRIEKEKEANQVQLSEGAVKNVIQSSMQVCRAKAEAKGIEMAWECDASLRAVINPQLLEQALINLIDNAIKYSGEKGVIHVDARQTDQEVVIRVADNGIGIAKQHLTRLFERFYRVDKARSREEGGTGLGLAIVKHIAKAHGGNVTVESLRGKGSTFSIHLPAVG